MERKVGGLGDFGNKGKCVGEHGEMKGKEKEKERKRANAVGL